MEQEEETVSYADIIKFLDSLSQQLTEKGVYSKSEFKILFWAVQRFLRLFGNPQPQHFDVLDETLARQLRAQGFSFDDIAFVLDRSKSSVYENLKTQLG